MTSLYGSQGDCIHIKSPPGGSIGLMRATWPGRPMVGKRTAAAPLTNSAAPSMRDVQ